MKSKIWNGIVVVALGSLIASPLFAVEIITRDDIVNNVVKKDQLVKVADNAIFLLDTSSSTNDKFGDTGLPVVQVVKSELKNRNAYFPDIGHNMGIYTYTGWKENYPVQPYNREKVAAALDTLPEKGSGPTPLNSALQKLDGILEPLSGRTAVFVFWDGEYTGSNPAETAKKLAQAHDACFYVISSADAKREVTLKEDVASLNACSRVIRLADFFNRPDYTSGALYDVKVTEHVVTTTDKKIVGLKLNDINFATNKTALAAEDKADLDKVVEFMKGKPKSYAVIAGYTDDVGSRDHNEGLSRRRAEMVASYLKEHGIDDSRMVLFWYGPNNPIVANDSPANQAKNRRVELAVGLGEKAEPATSG
ncbi:MAG: OmpA family protein [Vicinamibacterales bacterium]